VLSTKTFSHENQNENQKENDSVRCRSWGYIILSATSNNTSIRRSTTTSYQSPALSRTNIQR
jgi:hypothetical protein